MKRCIFYFNSSIQFLCAKFCNLNNYVEKKKLCKSCAWYALGGTLNIEHGVKPPWRLRAFVQCLCGKTKQPDIPALGWSEELTGILLCLSQLFVTSSLGAVTQEASVARGSAVCKACGAFWKCLGKGELTCTMDTWSRKPFVTAKRRLWIHPVPFTNIWSMFVWILKQIPRGEIKHKD